LWYDVGIKKTVKSRHCFFSFAVTYHHSLLRQEAAQ